MGTARGGLVLTTDDVSGLNRAALATVRALAGTPYRSVVTVSTPYALAASSRWCTAAVQVPRGGSPAYPDALRRLVQEGAYAAVLPASDVALVALGDPSAALVNKASLDESVRAAGLIGLPGRVFTGLAELHDAADVLDYPVAVKSVVKSGVGNLQAVRVDSAQAVRTLVATPGDLLVQPFVEEPIRAVSGVVWDGRFLALCYQTYLRLWPAEAGVAAAAVTVEGDASLEGGLLRLLAGHRGVFQVQLIGDHVLDVNPRVYGSMPLAVAAGANLPLIACDAAAGHLPRTLVRARPGVPYRWLEGDLRNLLHGLRRRELSAAQVVARFVPMRGTTHSVESVRDPRPTWNRLLRAAHDRGRSGR